MSGVAGRVVAVTGGGGALGGAVVQALEAAGARVSAPPRADVDLLDPDATAAWAAGLDGVDALVHLVGGWRGGQGIAEAPAADAAWLHDQLVVTLQHALRAFLPALAASGRGRVVMVSSPQAERPADGNAGYAAAKAAAESWTLSAARELAGHGGTANIVRVHAIVTPGMRAAAPEKPFRTFTDAQDVATAVAWLLSDAASRMTGQRLALHG